MWRDEGCEGAKMEGEQDRDTGVEGWMGWKDDGMKGWVNSEII